MFCRLDDTTNGRKPKKPKHFSLKNYVFTMAQGPDLQNILRQSYDMTIMPKLRLTYEGHLIYKTSYKGRNAFLGYDSLAKS